MERVSLLLSLLDPGDELCNGAKGVSGRGAGPLQWQATSLCPVSCFRDFHHAEALHHAHE